MTSIPKNWNAIKAWLCSVSLVVMQVTVAFIVVSVFVKMGEHSFTGHPMGNFLMNTIAGLFAVVITLLFAQPKTVEQFKASFALGKPKLTTAVFLAAIGAGLAGAVVLTLKMGFASPRNPLAEDFSASGSTGVAWLRFVVFTAPLVEELIVRGYLYPAFRQNYSIGISVMTILAIAAINHFPLITTSLVGVASVVCLNIILCLIREKTNSLWNCVLCHTAYNVVCALT